MGKDVNKLSLRSTLDVVTSIVLIAAAGTLAYRSVFVASSDTQAELQLPSEPMSIERAAIRGSEDAQAVMIVYSDFQEGTRGHYGTHGSPSSVCTNRGCSGALIGLARGRKSCGAGHTGVPA